MAIIVSENFLEAEDLKEALEMRGLGPVLHLRNAELAFDYLSRARTAPKVVVICVDITTAAAIACMTRATDMGAVIVHVTNDHAPARTGVSQVLQRPFEKNAVQSVLVALGL